MDKYTEGKNMSHMKYLSFIENLNYTLKKILMPQSSSCLYFVVVHNVSSLYESHK